MQTAQFLSGIVRAHQTEGVKLFLFAPPQLDQQGSLTGENQTALLASSPFTKKSKREELSVTKSNRKPVGFEASPSLYRSQQNPSSMKSTADIDRFVINSLFRSWAYSWRLLEDSSTLCASRGAERDEILCQIVIELATLLNTLVGSIAEGKRNEVVADSLNLIQAFTMRLYTAQVHPRIRTLDNQIAHLESLV